jgi:hypothetical protein
MASLGAGIRSLAMRGPIRLLSSTPATSAPKVLITGTQAEARKILKRVSVACMLTGFVATGALGQLGSDLTKKLRHRYGPESVVATDIRPAPNNAIFSKGQWLSSPRCRLLITQALQPTHPRALCHLRRAQLRAAGASRGGAQGHPGDPSQRASQVRSLEHAWLPFPLSISFNFFPHSPACMPACLHACLHPRLRLRRVFFLMMQCGG